MGIGRQRARTAGLVGETEPLEPRRHWFTTVDVRRMVLEPVGSCMNIDSMKLNASLLHTACRFVTSISLLIMLIIFGIYSLKFLCFLFQDAYALCRVFKKIVIEAKPRDQHRSYVHAMSNVSGNSSFDACSDLEISSTTHQVQNAFQPRFGNGRFNSNAMISNEDWSQYYGSSYAPFPTPYKV